MDRLNLPEFVIQVRGEEVFCLIRRKWVALTPEEWVRQHFLNLMIEQLKYPKGLIKLEHGHTYFKNAKRSDIVLFDRQGCAFLLVECKAPNVPIDKKVVQQAAQYNKVLEAQYLSVTNGLKHFIWNDEQQLHQFPPFPETSE